MRTPYLLHHVVILKSETGSPANAEGPNQIASNLFKSFANKTQNM